MTQSRQSKFIAISATSAWHPTGKLVLQLTEKERDELIEFLRESENLPNDQYMEKCNRWYLGSENKPKHLEAMWALAIQCK